MSKDIYKSFEHYGFNNYLKITTFHNMYRLICQYESKKKLFEENESPFDNCVTDVLDFDLVIIDEAKSFFNHTFSPTTNSTSKG